MDNKQAIEVLKEIKHNVLEDLASPVFRDLLKNYAQALDLAIAQIQVNEQIRKENISISAKLETALKYIEMLKADKE